MALLLAPVSEPAPQWLRCFAAELPELDVRVWPEVGNPADIEIAAVGHIPPGALARLPNLRVIFTLLAGQEHLLKDPNLPADIPIVRTTNPKGDAMMNEAALLHVLRHHRFLPEYLEAQERGEWISLPRLLPSERRVGIMGLGAIGIGVARCLAEHGFRVAGWARRQREIDGVEVYHGADQLPAFLARSEILVNLLALTAETVNIVNRDLLAKLPKGAAFINLGRGQHVVDADLMRALDSGQLAGATLDVYRQEPLPKESPLWRQKRLTIMPHTSRRLIAADIVPRICDGIRRFRRREKLTDLVDRAAGY